MSAETLRRAAALMRERAESATPGRWHPFGNSIGAEVDGCTCHGGVMPYGHEQYCGIEGPVVVQGHETDIAHIASWHPAVALAVADWLDAMVARAEMKIAKGGNTAAVWAHEIHALSVARAYLGADA